MSNRVGVIGAGPAGLAAAYSLGKSGIPVDVFEASAAVGGMAQTILLWNQLVDLGPHRFFSTHAAVNRLWLEIVGSDYRMVERRTRIFYDDKFFDYPLRLADSLGKLGSIESVRCLMSYLRQQLAFDRPAANFEQWVRGRFGKRLYERFFRDYSEKLWGLRCESLDADFAAQRIRKLSLYEAARNALANGRGNRHATLVDQFAYPIVGTGSVYNKMADAIFRQAGTVHLGKAVRRVLPHREEGMELELASGERHTYQHIISTMPLTQLIHALPDAPQKVLEANSRLHYRNTILVYLRMDCSRINGSISTHPNWLSVALPISETGFPSCIEKARIPYSRSNPGMIRTATDGATQTSSIFRERSRIFIKRGLPWGRASQQPMS
jgi:protoporphyrinogen oxidase